jgi:hypothetical protein
MGLFDRLFGPPAKDKFAALMADAIRAAGEPAGLRYDANEFRLTAESGPGNFLQLQNAYAEYCAAPSDGREAVVRRYVRIWFSYRKAVPDEFADVRPDLLPGVRARSTFELTPLRLRAQGDGETVWPYRVLAGHLGVGVVYDLPESMSQVQQERLDKWGITLDEALATAGDNLRRVSGGDFEQPAPGVWLSPWRDNYDASRLVLPDLLARYEVRGDLVAAVPNRDVLILTGSEDEAGLRFLFAQIEEHMEKPRPLSALPVRLDGQTWLPYRPDPDGELFQRFRLLHLKSLGQDYADQAEALKALHEKTVEDVFVASFSGVQRGGAVLSYCVWSEGVESLLPRTDEVFFVRPTEGGEGKVAARGNWDRVMQVVGDLARPCGLYPERYRVRDFPTPAQLAEINDPDAGAPGS